MRRSLGRTWLKKAYRDTSCCNQWQRVRIRTLKFATAGSGAHILQLPEDARWNAELQAVEFGVGIGEYEGVVQLPRYVFQRLVPKRPTPERCLDAYHLQRTL
jgi:hypothetical protein